MTAERHPSDGDRRSAGARSAPGVRIGAYAVVGPEVVLGDDVEVGHHVVLEGRVDARRRACASVTAAIVGGTPQDLKFKDGTPSGVRIGAGTVIREHVTVHRATTPGGLDRDRPRRACSWRLATSPTTAGSATHVIVINYAGITGHCQIGDRATIGGLTGIVPFTRIGTRAYVGGMAKVNADVPPFMLVDGQPATVRGGERHRPAPGRHARPPSAGRCRTPIALLFRSGLAPPRARSSASGTRCRRARR